LLCLNGNISGLSPIGQMGQLGTVPKWGNVGAILIARQNGAKKRGCSAPSNESFSEDCSELQKTT